jgi:TP901 family phage tail tape measure protein
VANFVTSITLQFRDAFSSGFADAKNSMAGMKDALGEINKNKDMFDLAGDLSLMSSRFDELSGKISSTIEEPSRLAGAFDSSMRNIQSLSGQSDESLRELGETLLDIGAKSVAGPNAAAEAFYNITSGVSNAAVRMDTLTAAINLAETGQANLGAATSGLISVVNAYNTPAEKMTDLSDVFFQTVRKGVGSLDGFVGAMSSIAGMASSSGVGFDELGSSMAFITAKGQTESVAATQLKAAMVSLMRPNKELSEALQAVGISSGSAMLEQYGLAASLDIVKQALGSVEALQAAMVLTDESYNSFARDYAGGLSGATANALAAQAKSYEAQVARLNSAQESLKVQMGDDINGIKGFFVGIHAGFLNNVVAPLMSSPVGGVFQRIAAGAAVAAQGIFSMGGTALNTATQLVTLTATLNNAGGLQNCLEAPSEGLPVR